MSRKTNKTNHVLNLLSNGVSTEEEKETKAEETKEELQDVKKEQQSSVSVVKAAENEVAETIRKSLEKELEEYEEARKQEKDRRTEKKELKQEVPAAEDSQRKEEQETPAEEPPAAKAEEQKDSVQKSSQTAPTEEKKAQQEPKAENASKKTKESERQAEEDNLVTVNVMEALVKERAPEYIRQFEVCGCKRCRMDVEAVALSELPAKYVVINKYAISPLINFYRTKFAGRVTVEVAKACMAVKNNPRHSLDQKEKEDSKEK